MYAKFERAAWQSEATAARSNLDATPARSVATLRFEFNEAMRMARGGTFPQFVIDKYGQAALDATAQPHTFAPMAQRVLKELIEELEAALLRDAALEEAAIASGDDYDDSASAAAQLRNASSASDNDADDTKLATTTTTTTTSTTTTNADGDEIEIGSKKKDKKSGAGKKAGKKGGGASGDAKAGNDAAAAPSAASESSNKNESGDASPATAMPEPERVVSSSGELFVADNVNCVFEVPLDAFQRVVTEGAPKELLAGWKLVGGNARLLVRESTVALLELLENLRASSFVAAQPSAARALRADGTVELDCAPGVPHELRRDALGNLLRREPADVRRDRLLRELGGRTPTIFLDGAAGVGKTAALLQAVLWARTNGWIVLYVKDAHQLLNGGTEATPSPLFAGQFDQNDFAQKEILAPLLAAHRADLAARRCQTSTSAAVVAHVKAAAIVAENEALQLQRDAEAADAAAAAAAARAGSKVAPVGKSLAAQALAAAQAQMAASQVTNEVAKAASEADVTLLQLLQLGVERKSRAASVVAALVDELACVVDAPVLIAIDNVNALDTPSAAFYDPELLKLPGYKAPRTRDDIDMNSFDDMRAAPPPNKKTLAPSKVGGASARLRKSQLTLGRALGSLEAQGLANGVVLGALCHRHAQDFLEIDERRNRTHQLDAYTADEMLAVLQDYSATGVSLERVTFAESQYVASITGRRAREVLSYAQIY